MSDNLTEDEYELIKKSVTDPDSLSWTTGYRLKQIKSKIGREKYEKIMDQIKSQNKRTQRRLSDFT